MTSTPKTYTFIYSAIPYVIPYIGKETFKEMIIKFIEVFNKESKIHDYNFYYQGQIIDPTTYDLIIKDNKNNESIIITVDKNIKVIECPKCNYGDCVVSLINYKTTFYNCEHKHLEISTYDNYFTDQIYYPEKIRCAGNNDCKKNAKMDSKFFLCLTCSKMQDKTRSICSECIEKHKIEYKDSNHFIINYEDKNYYCKNHCKKMENYCFQCKKNLCNGCVEEHLKDKEKKEHKIKNIDLLIPDEKELKQLYDSLKEIKKNINDLKVVIDKIIYTLNGAMRIYENYYRIASHIITKYETFNRDANSFKNFTIFKSLRNLKFSNNQILEDLKSIINEKNDIDKAMTLIGIYSDKKRKYNLDEKIGNDLNKEDDGDWFKEVCEREKRKGNKEDSVHMTNQPKPKPNKHYKEKK